MLTDLYIPRSCHLLIVKNCYLLCLRTFLAAIPPAGAGQKSSVVHLGLSSCTVTPSLVPSGFYCVPSPIMCEQPYAVALSMEAVSVWGSVRICACSSDEL